MVKIIVSFLLFFTVLNAGEIDKKALLNEKIKLIVGEKVFIKHSSELKRIFSKTSRYYIKNRVNIMRVASRLRSTGYMKLRFREPKDLTISFKATTNPMFFVKIMSDTLRTIGYYRYVTTHSSLDNREFTWTITLKTESATNPVTLQNKLLQSSCKIVGIKRNSATNWEYTIDTSHARLNVKKLRRATVLKLKRSLYAHWLNVSKIKKLSIESGERNLWYPQVTYYDSSLHILKVYKKDKKTDKIVFRMPKNSVYMKISDMNSMKNLKDDLVFNPIGYR